MATSDLERLVRSRRISRFELRPDKIVVYLDRLAPRGRLAFSYRLTAPFPLKVVAPPSSAYEYYNAEFRTPTDAAILTVRWPRHASYRRRRATTRQLRRRDPPGPVAG